VNEAAVLAADETPEAKLLLCDHSTVYAGLARPLPLSVEAVQLHCGAELLAAVLALGVPGVVGTTVSISTLPLGEKLELLPTVSLAMTRKYQTPSASGVGWV